MAREAWTVDWEALRTPLGLPGQRQGVCVRKSFIALEQTAPAREAEVHFYATSLSRAQAGAEQLTQMIRGHWSIENQLHHVKDRTWLEDRHWMGGKKTGAIVTMLRTMACALTRRARVKGLAPKAFCPERIEFFARSPHHAVALLKGAARL